MTKTLKTLVCTTLLVCGGGLPPASAQQVMVEEPDMSRQSRHGLDVSAGYALVRDSGRGKTMPAAWMAGLTFDLSPRLSVIGETDGAYKEVGQQEYRTHAFMAGVRSRIGGTGRGATTPFVQALAGTSCYCGSSVQAGGAFSKGLALQVGGGVEVPVGGGLGLRLQGDVRQVRGNGLTFNQVRVGIGMVVGLTRR